MKKNLLRFARHNRTFNICLFAVGLILLGYIIFNSIEISRNMHDLNNARLEFQAYTRVKTRLRDGSDNLTESVRRYVTTGEKKFRDEYFKEAEETKKREWGIGLLERLSDEGEVTKRIKQYVHDAMGYSVELMNLEYTAMRLVATEEDLADPSYPQALRNADVPAGDLEKGFIERKRMAIRMLFSDEYAESKQAIYNALDDSLLGAAKLADFRREEAASHQTILWINQIVSMALFVLTFLVLLIWSEYIFTRRTAFLQEMLDSIPLMIYLKDRKTRRYLDYNRPFSDYLHLSGREDLRGKTDHDVLNSDTAREIEINDEDALGKRNKPTVYYETVPGPSGQPRYFRTIKLGIRDPDGALCLLGMALDMTEEHERRLNNEATEEALIMLQQEPLLATPVKMLEIIRRRLNADYCYMACYREVEGVISIDPEAFVIRGGRCLPKQICSGTRSVSDLIDRVRLLGCCTFNDEESVRLRKIFRVDQTAPDTPRAATHIAMRLTVQGEFRGILSVAYVSNRNLNDPEKDYFLKNAHIFEAALERATVYDALARAKNEAIDDGNISSSVLNLMPIPCVVKDPANEFRYIRCNRAYASLHHLDPSEMVGKRNEDFYADDSLDFIRRTDAETMEKREMIHFEHTCLWGDCDRRVFLYWKLPITLKDGRTLLVSVAQDITGIRRKINSEHFRSEITAFLFDHSEPEELLDFAAKRLIETLGCQHVLLHRHDGTRRDWFPDDDHVYCNKCADCPLKTADPALFCHRGNAVLNDGNISDFPLPDNCPNRILIARRIFFGGDEWGRIGTLFTGDAFEPPEVCEELLEQVADAISACIERKAHDTVIRCDRSTNDP